MQPRPADNARADQPPHGIQLPVVISRPAPQGSGATPPGAEFISQLIAERQHLAPQRERRRAPVATALDSYRQAAAQAVRRMPPGYRKTLLV